MNLNNNWSRNIDNGKWTPTIESLKKTDFDAFKQDLKTYRFYQKCLSGSTYVGVDSVIKGENENVHIDNVYDILNMSLATQSSYYYDLLGPSPLQYLEPFTGSVPENPIVIIGTSSESQFLDKIIPDYNRTLKNLFTPERLINDQKDNLFYVDLATTTIYDDLSIDFTGLNIDGIVVKEGHRILVKDQIVKVTIPTSTDPDTYFDTYYEIDAVVGLNTTYRVPSSDNGIYMFTKRRLVRTSDLDTYEKVMRYSICVKLGESNRERQFKLRRLNTGNFPEYASGEPMYFEEGHNFILRQRVDYNNLYELSLQDTLKHATQSLIVSKISGSVSATYSYTIPERSITLGEFGVIINDQEGITNIINSKYKSTLRSISQTSRYYWVCGDDGLLLRVDKIDFSIKRIQLDFSNNHNKLSDSVMTSLTSINFFNDLRGVVVGKFNQIWVTSDSGKTWTQIYLNDFDGYSYNKALFVTIDKFYVGGDNGVFIEFEYNLGNWNAHKRRISKYLDGLDDEYLLVDNITDMTSFYNGSNLYITIGCELNNIYLYDVNNSLSNDYDFLYLQDTINVNNQFGDVTGMTYLGSTNSLFFSTFDAIYQINPISGTLGVTNSNIFSTTFSVFTHSIAINSISSYTASNELIYTGNFSLWKKNSLSYTQSSDVYDIGYFNRLKPRLLFMDYDIGSKLYWFDDYSQYRIPERYEIPTGMLQGSGTDTWIGFNPNTNTITNGLNVVTYSETNWITYFKDRQKTFEYYSNLEDAYVVHPSFTFSSSDVAGITFSYATPSVTVSYTDIVGLMPSATPPMQLSSVTQSSRFRSITGVPITIPTVSGPNLYFYDYLGIWRESFISSNVLPEVGDVLKISSDVFEGRFIINKIVSTSSFISSGSSATLTIIFFASPVLGTTLQVFYGAMAISSIVISAGASLPAYLNLIVNDINSITGTTGFSAFVSAPNRITINAPIGSSYNNNGITVVSSMSPLSILGGRFSGGHDIVSSIDAFFYFYTDFNENILNNILGSSTGFEVRDLNKYPLSPNGLTNSQYFVDNFNSHYINYSYDCEQLLSTTQSFMITPKYSQWSAYYNLQSTVDVLDRTSTVYSDEIKYATGFLNFGYSPTYNLLSYLNYIDNNEFQSTKEFFALPNWIAVPGPQLVPGDLDNQIYVDSGVESNKLFIGSNLKYIWDSIFNGVFYDLNVTDLNANIVTTLRLLVIDKYYDLSNNWYVIEFHDKIQYVIGVAIYYIDIISRRTLQKISDDLQYINRLHRTDWMVSESYDTLTLSAVTGTWSNYETDLNFKVSTDSYTKVLLSDHSIIKHLTGIIYTDYKNELSMQVTKLDREYEFILASMSVDLMTGNYQFDFTYPHLLSNNDYVIVSMIGTQSSYPSTLLGYHNINVNGTYSIVVPVPSVGLFPVFNFKIDYVKKDYFFNFQPIDIFDLGIGDKKIKQSVEVKNENWDVIGSQYDLFDLDLSKYKFRLVDGLDLVTLNANFPWILEAEVSGAIIGVDKNGNIIWYDGIWHCGRWFGGTWVSGTWVSGDWYYGTWTSRSISNNILNIRVDNKNTNNYDSVWFDGRWFDGSWENGTWYGGRWYSGTHSDGRWFDGTWNDGLWQNGQFMSGIWVSGQWDNGIFNTDNGPAYWLDGKFYGGDFENGVWYNGIFDEKNSLISRFGTKSFNTRNSIWRSGKFLAGQFHSFLNTNDNGYPDVSDVHKYSKWYTGLFSGGDFYGGISYNINFKNTVWHGGISEDIEVVNINPTFSQIGILGDYPFNVNDEFYLVDNGNTGTPSIFGSTIDPIKYKVLDAEYDTITNITSINTDVNLYSIGTYSGTVSNLRLVSSFDNSTWNSGLWYNGVFKDGVFNGGIWYNGYFDGSWG